MLFLLIGGSMVLSTNQRFYYWLESKNGVEEIHGKPNPLEEMKFQIWHGDFVANRYEGYE